MAVRNSVFMKQVAAASLRALWPQSSTRLIHVCYSASRVISISVMLGRRGGLHTGRRRLLPFRIPYVILSTVGVLLIPPSHFPSSISHSSCTATPSPTLFSPGHRAYMTSPLTTLRVGVDSKYSFQPALTLPIEICRPRPAVHSHWMRAPLFSRQRPLPERLYRRRTRHTALQFVCLRGIQAVVRRLPLAGVEPTDVYAKYAKIQCVVIHTAEVLVGWIYGGC